MLLWFILKSFILFPISINVLFLLNHSISFSFAFPFFSLLSTHFLLIHYGFISLLHSVFVTFFALFPFLLLISFQQLLFDYSRNIYIDYLI